jgi:hypothetical protein
VSIATFSPPIKATVLASSLPCIIIAIEETPGGDDSFVAIDTNGHTVYLNTYEFTYDFRYDPVMGWSDPNEAPGDFGDDE